MTQVFNLVFPSHRDSMAIFGHRFTRVPEYRERVQALQHQVGGFREFYVPRSTGGHAITAVVVGPTPAAGAVLPWRHPNASALDDILLLLSLFTSRHVFSVESLELDDVIVADHREYAYGRSLKLSLPHRRVPLDHGLSYNAGFEEGIEAAYIRIRTPAWIERHARGAFLLLFREACKRQALESSFINCWMLWEHFFWIHHRGVIGTERRRSPTARKIGFVLREYEIYGAVTEHAPRGLRRLIELRNMLVHEGGLFDERAERDALLFVRMTDHLVAKALGLVPSETLVTRAEFHSFLVNESRGVESIDVGTATGNDANDC